MMLDSLCSSNLSLAYAVFVPTVVISLAYLIRFRRTRTAAADEFPPATANVNKDRKYGVWTPVQFNYPSITPCPFEPLEMKPIPYRPFRAGEYHVTMGIRSMNWNEWIEIDSQYKTYNRIRSHRILTRRSDVIRVLPDNAGLVGSGGPAAIELVHEIAEYLSRRFPTIFEISRHTSAGATLYVGWGGAPPIKTIRIVPLEVSYNLPLDVHDGEEAPMRALEVAALLVQEDFALMIEGTDGKYYFQAGAILVPGSWRIRDKIGLSLDEIHNSGNVPRYKEKLQMSMERFFQKMSVDKPVARNNYLFQVVKPPGTSSEEDIDPEELAWAESSHGPEDGFTHAHPAHQPSRPKPTPSLIRLRTERQTLRRLPQTGAIAFTIRTYLTPVESLGQESGVARRLATALRGWGRDIGAYKGKEGGGWWDVVMEFLDQCQDKEMKSGEGSESGGNYPF